MVEEKLLSPCPVILLTTTLPKPRDGGQWSSKQTTLRGLVSLQEREIGISLIIRCSQNCKSAALLVWSENAAL